MVSSNLLYARDRLGCRTAGDDAEEADNVTGEFQFDLAALAGWLVESHRLGKNGAMAIGPMVFSQWHC